ncbi:MAG TPA: T9SS type A sorting domain-containing protein [Balneolales bacterium]|nr:T9SS type A sorting domain-containing protein [Balneolales bacterium]
MDSGYDAPSTEHNSTWNGYNNHNVMTLDYDKNVDHGGLDSPIFDAYSGRKTSSEQQVTDLKLEKLHSGTIYHLSGSVWLHTLHNDNPERWANYKRNVLFINSNKPYVIDLNSITNDYTNDLASFYMQYYGNGTSIWLEGSGWSSWGDPSHPNATRLFISYGAVEFNTDEGYASAGYSSQDATIEETNNDIETIKKIMLTSYGNNHNFNTVAFFRVDNQPPSNLPYTLVPYNGSTTLPNQAWAYRQDANTIDVVAERSHIDTTAFNQPFHFFVKDANGNKLTPLTLPAGKTYGFVRITKQDNYWFVEPDYKLNLEQPDYFAADTTIGTKTFPMNTDIYINNNTTVTVTGTITLQSGTTVHLGTNAVIKTNGSGNIQATGTVFKTLSGSNSASDRWTHIKLEGNGGSTFTQCTFQGASQALYLNSTNTIDRCTFQYNSCGLYAWKGEAYITGSTFINNYDYGIFLGGTGVAATNAYEGSSFIATQITGSNYGVYIYDNAWAELKYTQVDDNNYGAINYNYSILYAGNHNDSGGNASYVSQGWNRFNGNTNYAVYNGSSESDWADDNWWGTTSPPSSYFYGTVSHNNPLTYDPTISGAINVGGGSGCPPNCTFSAVTTSGDQAMNSGKVTTSSNNPSVRKNISDRLSDIYLQLDNHPDADGNYRLLQEAYGLTQLYDREDSSKILTRLDDYSSQYKTVMDVASNQVNTAGKLQSNLFAKSHPLSNAMRKLGTTAVLLKMDYLLHESEWKQMQILADQFAPYVTTNDDKSAFLASRAVAWENQKQFAKALSAYKQIDVMYSDTVLSSNNVAPDYSFIESNLKDSMQVYNQSVVASSRANLQSESSLSKSKTLPKEFSLGDNYPNPFNPTTTFPINLPKESQVKVVIYNITGQRVATLTDRVYQAGRYQLRFDAHHLASGVYIIRARLGEKTFTKQLTFIK